MQLIVLAQSKEYLMSLGLPEEQVLSVQDIIKKMDKKEKGRYLFQIQLVSFGVPEENLTPILDYITTLSKDEIGKIFPQIKKNPQITIDELKNFKILTPEERAKQQLEKKDVPIEILNWAKAIDPKYIDWLSKQAIAKEVMINGEDNDKVKDVLKGFDKLKKKSDFPKENKDINMYEKFSDLFELVKNLVPKSEEPLPGESDQDVMYNQDGIKVLHITDWQKAMEFSQGTLWCVRYEHMAKSYSSQGKDFYFVFINDSRVALIHHPSKQIKDPLDHALNNYNIIKQIDPVLEQLGIKPPPTEFIDSKFTPGFDYYRYGNMLTVGKEVNESVQSSANKTSTLRLLQNKFEVDWANNGEENHVVLLLSDEHFDDPQIQKYAQDYYDKEISNMGFGKNVFDESGPYKKIPYAMSFIPSIRNKNVEFAREQFENGNNIYKNIGKELKVVKEIRESYFNYWKNKIQEDPLSFEREEIPEAFLLKLKPYYIKSLVENLKEGKSYYYENRYSPVTVPLYDKLPDELKKDPEIKAAYRQGLLAFNASSTDAFLIIPEEFKNDPEFVAANKKAWENYVAKILPTIAAGPKEFLVKSTTNTIAFGVYDKLPDEFKNRKDVKKAYKQGLQQFVSVFIKAMSKLPEEFQDDPEIKQSNKIGWFRFIYENATKIKNPNTGTVLAGINVINLLNFIPDNVIGDTEYWPEVAKEVIVPGVIAVLEQAKTLNHFFHDFSLLPEQVREEQDIVKYASRKVLKEMDLDPVYYFNLGLYKYPEVKELPGVLKKEKEIVLRVANGIKNGEINFDNLSENAQIIPDFINANKIFMNVQPISPTSVKSVKQNVVKQPQKLQKQIKTTQPTQPTQPTQIEETTNTQETVEAKNWYSLIKISTLSKIPKRYFPQETLEIESLE
jgi:hypothetical protein